MKPRPQSLPVQLEFTWRDETEFRRELEAAAGFPMQLTMTNNTSSVMSVRRATPGSIPRVRLHRMFLEASPAILQAVAHWIRSPRSCKYGACLNAFIRAHTHHLRARPARRTRCITQGAHFDLAALFDEVNREHFDGRVASAITWGRLPVTRRRRSIRFGSYYASANLIRIHPLLDQDFVPLFFVKYIVFHEMLHAFLDKVEPEKGRRLHGPAFKRREKAYPNYALAVAWERTPANLNRLLARTKTAW